MTSNFVWKTGDILAFLNFKCIRMIKLSMWLNDDVIELKDGIGEVLVTISLEMRR